MIKSLLKRQLLLPLIKNNISIAICFTTIKPSSTQSLQSKPSQTHISQRLSQIKNCFSMNLYNQLNKNLENKQAFHMYFTDQKLLQLMKNHYFLNNLTMIANKIIYYFEKFTNVQIIFLLYTHKVYFSQVRQNKQFYKILQDYIIEKVIKKQFTFETQQIQDLFLDGMAWNLPTINHQYQDIINKSKVNFIKFLCMKVGLMIVNSNGDYVFVKQLEGALHKIHKIMKYLPKNSEQSGNDLKDFEFFFSNVLEYETLMLSKCTNPTDALSYKRCQQLASVLVELTIRVGNICKMFVNIYGHFPAKFDTKENFLLFLHFLNFISIYPLLSRIEFHHMDQFHSKLVKYNKIYSHDAEVIKKFNQYCESLIVCKIKNIYIFEEFYGINSKHIKNNFKKFNQRDADIADEKDY